MKHLSANFFTPEHRCCSGASGFHLDLWLWKKGKLVIYSWYSHWNLHLIHGDFPFASAYQTWVLRRQEDGHILMTYPWQAWRPIPLGASRAQVRDGESPFLVWRFVHKLFVEGLRFGFQEGLRFMKCRVAGFHQYHLMPQVGLFHDRWGAKWAWNLNFHLKECSFQCMRFPWCYRIGWREHLRDPTGLWTVRWLPADVPSRISPKRARSNLIRSDHRTGLYFSARNFLTGTEACINCLLLTAALFLGPLAMGPKLSESSPWSLAFWLEHSVCGMAKICQTTYFNVPI